MTVVAVPAFDVEALRSWEPLRDEPPLDRRELEKLWRQLIDDLVAAAARIDLLQADA